MYGSRDAGAVTTYRFYPVLFLGLTSYATFFLPRNLVSNDVSMIASWVFAFSWLLTPPAIYIDVRSVRNQDVGWTPRTPYWVLGCLLPVIHMSTLVPYVLRRYEKAVRRESWGTWWRIAGLGASVPVLLVLADIVLLDYLTPGSETVETALTEVGSVAFVGVTVLVPVAVKYDISYVRDRYEWEPDKLWVLGAVPWFLNFLVITAYNFKRNPDSPYTVIDDDREESARGARNEAQQDRGDTRETVTEEVESGWWYIPLGTSVFVLFLVTAAIGLAILHLNGVYTLTYALTLPAVSLLLLTALAGYLSLAAIYFDAKAIKRAGADWQPLVPAYIIAAVLITPLLPPIIYVIQRHRHIGEP